MSQKEYFNDLPLREYEQRNSSLQLGVLISDKGTGSNLQAGIDAIQEKRLNAQINLVLSDRRQAKGLDRARSYGIPTEVMRLTDRTSDQARIQYSIDVAQALNSLGIQTAVLAGFMTILSQEYFDVFNGITLNIHPGNVPDLRGEPFRAPDQSVVPWNRGMMTDNAVEQFLNGTYACSSIHVATPQTDFGPVLRRMWEPVMEGDTVDTLYGRLKLKEHQGLIESLNELQQFGWEQYRQTY